MAATRLIVLHVNKGKTVAQCLADRTDYSQNVAKTEDGKYISSYECDPKTADEEFLLTKRQYQHITGRQQKNDIIAYQIHQSFKPGEITPEEANRVGYETAMRWTKGKHAFIVATHIDRSHIHNHIIYNSTSLECTRKFKNFFLEENREEIQIHKAAKQMFEQLPERKVPSRQVLNEEFHRCLSEKKKAYTEYRQVKKRCRNT